MMTAFAAALLLVAGQPVNEPQDGETTFSERQPVRLAPLPAERAFAAFRDICIMHLVDPAGFDRAAAASGLGFVRADEPRRGTQEWSSVHGQVVLREPPRLRRPSRQERREGIAPRERPLERCDYWLAIEERLDPAALVAAIGARLAPGSRPMEEIIGVSWPLQPLGAGTSLKLVYLPSIDDPRLFTLSLQRFADIPR
jgi:hypothetical protein